MKPVPDEKRFARYLQVVNALLAGESFQKPDIYKALKKGKRPFIGRVIGELVRDGYLTMDGLKSRPRYSWSEKKKEFNPGRWIDTRVFAPTVKRAPSGDRPRERLLRFGPAELKTSELLAILIRSGIHGESALHAAEKIAARFGHDLQDLSLRARGELRQISRAVGETAYCQIMAALELGKRLALQQKGEVEKPFKIKSTASALAFCRRHFERLAREGAKEEFHVVLLDEAHQVIRTVQVTVGLSNKSLVHPREVFGPAIQESASALILVHNHPTGDPTPSHEDMTITRDLKDAADILGLRLLDHIIIARAGAASMKEGRLL